MIKVVIADDQNLVRGGIRMILETEPDIEVAAEASTGREAVEAVLRHRPDVVVMDVRMPEMDGLEATKHILAQAPDTHVLIVTTFDLDEYVYRALEIGAGGFMLKDAPPAKLTEAVRTVAAGEALHAPSVTRRLVEHFLKRRPVTPVEIRELTERELEVLKLMGRGLSNAEIAHELYLGEATIKTHVTRIFAKLNLRDRAQVVVFAYESGLVQPGDNR